MLKYIFLGQAVAEGIQTLTTHSLSMNDQPVLFRILLIKVCLIIAPYFSKAVGVLTYFRDSKKYRNDGSIFVILCDSTVSSLSISIDRQPLWLRGTNTLFYHCFLIVFVFLSLFLLYFSLKLQMQHFFAASSPSPFWELNYLSCSIFLVH